MRNSQKGIAVNTQCVNFMKYISLDTETTSATIKTPANLLMLSMVVEDTENIVPVTELPHFTCYLGKNDDTYTGSAGAIAMNGWIFEILAGKKEANYPIYDITDPFFKVAVEDFFTKHIGMQRKFLAGKNVATFDLFFLPKWLKDHFKARVIDPGSVFVDFKSEEVMKSLGSLKKQFGMKDPVTHDAREDAMDVIRILRKKYVK